MFAGDLNHAQRRAVESDGARPVLRLPRKRQDAGVDCQGQARSADPPDPWIVMTTPAGTQRTRCRSAFERRRISQRPG